MMLVQTIATGLLASVAGHASPASPPEPTPAPVVAPGRSAEQLPTPSFQRTAEVPQELQDSEVSAESAQLEELRALEELELNPEGWQDARVLSVIRGMGYGHPLRHHVERAYQLKSAAPNSHTTHVPLITDLQSFNLEAIRDKYDIPVEMHPLVAQYIQFFQGRGRKWFRRWMSRSTRYAPLMLPILEAHGMPRDTLYLAMIESGFSPHAYSWAHAAGPWQFIAATGAQYRLKQDFWVDERRDPVKSTRAASKFLTHLYRDLGHWHLAWAGYNTGPGRVRRVVQKKGTDNFWKISEGRGLAKETKHYVPKLIAAALVAKHYREFGFTDEEFDFEEPFTFDEVKVDAATDLEVLAAAANTSVEELKELNPELKRWCTPPATAENPYVLRVPQGSGAIFQERYATLDPSQKMNFRIHQVKRGDTLTRIASRHKTVPEVIMRMNGLQTVRTLKVGTELLIPIPSAHQAASEHLAQQATLARKAGYVAPSPDEEIPAGTFRKSPKGTVKTERINGRTRITYGVAPGDSLWLIGQRFGCTVDELRRWNDLPSHATLKVGMALTLWKTGDAAKPGSPKARHTLR